MATHSSILAWEIPRERSLEGYSPRCLKRVRHDLATKQPQPIHYHSVTEAEKALEVIWIKCFVLINADVWKITIQPLFTHFS